MDESPGQIITFYSYKGGTGRTMALANVACLLAQRQAEVGGKGVLMIDWDLEAPGLHRYFQGRLKRPGSYFSTNDDAIDDAQGLIDMFRALSEATRNPDSSATTSSEGISSIALGSERLAKVALDKVKPEQYALETKSEGLYLIKAGRFSKKDPEEYSRNVNTFNWEALYHQSPMLIRLLAERLASRYQYVLIDSRTGITDSSGICTMLLPEKLVAVFTPNRQSLTGVLELIKRATDYRRESHDLRPLTVFPLVSRIEANEPRLREKWRFGNEEKTIPGYQPEFEKVFNAIYKRSDVKLEDYFDEMQIQHIPYYAYGEEIAVLVEKIGDKFSLRRSYKSFANRLVHSKVPWGKLDAGYEASQSYTPSLRERLTPVFARLKKHRQTLTTALVTLLVVLVTVLSIMLGQAHRDLTSARQSSENLVNERDKSLAELQFARLSLENAQMKLQEVQAPADLIDGLRKQINSLTNQLNEQAKIADRQIKDAQQDGINQRNIRKQKETQMDSLQKQLDTSQQKKTAAESAYTKLKEECMPRAQKKGG